MAGYHGAIYGVVSEEGSIKANNPVVLMDHATLKILARTLTDVNGGYMFNYLDKDKTDYMVFTVDNTGPEPKNALIRDYVTPITVANGSLNGNFMGVVTALKPAFGIFPMIMRGSSRMRDSSSAGGLAGVSVCKPFGCGSHPASEIDYGGNITMNIIDVNAQTNPNGSVDFPIPTSDQIVGIKSVSTYTGWQMQPTAWTMHDPDDYDLQWGRNDLNTPMTFVVVVKPLTGQYISISVGQNVRSDQWEAQWRARSDTHNSFWGNNNTYRYAAESHFYITVDPDLQVRLKWFGDTERGQKRIELVSGGALTTNEWYMIVVRVAINNTTPNSATPTSVKIINLSTGVIRTETTSTTTGSTGSNHSGRMGTWFTQKWGEQGAAEGPLRRHSLMVSGQVNFDRGNGNFTRWDGSAYQWQNGAVPLSTSATPPSYGPCFWFNKWITDAEVDWLFKSAYDVNTPERYLPRFYSEVLARAPGFFLPGDEPVGTKGFATENFQRAVSQSFGNSLDYIKPGISCRRRQIIRPGRAGARYYGIRPEGYCTSSILINFWCASATPGTCVLVNVTEYNDSTNIETCNQYHTTYIALGNDRRLRWYTRKNDNGYIDVYSTALAVPGQMNQLIIASDNYTGLNVKFYLNGVLSNTVSLGQVLIGSYYSGIDSAAWNCGRFTTYCDSAAEWGGNSGKHATVNENTSVAEVAFFNQCFGPTDVAELYNAFLIATGPDAYA